MTRDRFVPADVLDASLHEIDWNSADEIEKRARARSADESVAAFAEGYGRGCQAMPSSREITAAVSRSKLAPRGTGPLGSHAHLQGLARLSMREAIEEGDARRRQANAETAVYHALTEDLGEHLDGFEEDERPRWLGMYRGWELEQRSSGVRAECSDCRSFHYAATREELIDLLEWTHPHDDPDADRRDRDGDLR